MLQNRTRTLIDRFESLDNVVESSPLSASGPPIGDLIQGAALASRSVTALSEFITSSMDRHYVETLIERLIDYLDANDAPFQDLEPEQERCEAFDDLGSDRVEDLQPNLVAPTNFYPGDAEDAEVDGPLFERELVKIRKVRPAKRQSRPGAMHSSTRVRVS
jgi:hypothetical protein